MKIAVSCDAVVGRDWYIEVVEAALDVLTGLYGQDNFELYTLIHKEGSLVGPIEQRSIHSTFLSNMCKSYDDLLKNNYLIPNAAKNLFIPCSVDFVINISRGFSHGIKKCDRTTQLSFIVEDVNALPRKKSFKEKIFSSLVKSFQLKKLRQADMVWTASWDLIPNGIDAKLVSPPVKLTDYKLLPDSMFARDYILVNATPLDEEQALKFIKDFKDIKFKFVGVDDHLEALKAKHEELFFGDRCGGELAPLLSGCRYLLDFETAQLPVMSLKAMSCGRPVFSKGNPFMDFGVGFYEAVEMKGLGNLAFPEFDRNEVRARALKFEELKFKHLLKKTLESKKQELEGTQALYNVDPDNCC